MNRPYSWDEILFRNIHRTTKSINPKLHPNERFDLYSIPSYSKYTPDSLLGAEIGSAKQEVQENDVLVSRIFPHIRRSWSIPGGGSNRTIASSEWIVVSSPALDTEFVRQFFLSDIFHHEFMKTVSGVGGSLMRARPALAGDIRIPVPPIAEQRRIVSKLLKIQTRTSKGRRNLRQIPVIARSLRAAAVRRAFTGDLTDYWRRDIGLSDPAARWALPANWRWRTLGQIADIRSGITLGRRYPPDSQLLERPYLRVANVQRGRLDLSQIKTIKITAKEADQLSLRTGDILMNEGGDRDKLGRGWVWDGQIPDCIHQNHVFRVRPNDSENVSKYISYYANEFGQDFFFEQGTQTTNLASISKSKLSGLPVPLAPPDEQAEIVRRLDDVFARADRLEAEANRALALLDRLEAVILDKAFRGELVPQDPNDEPASVMLGRIRVERATQKPARRRKATAAVAD